jgi:hypothetical protein
MSARQPTRWVPLASFVICSMLLAACSSSSAPATMTTHPKGLPYLSRVGTGDATLPPVAVPAAWSLVWHFSCTDPASPRPFALTATRTGGATTHVTDQAGLGGGGYHPFTAAGGIYTFTVTTTCGWQVLAGTPGTQTIPATIPATTPSTAS